MNTVGTVGAAATGDDVVSASSLLVEFARWLDRQRGLAPITVRNYCWHVEQFLTRLPQPVRLGVLDAGTVTAFMVGYCRDRNTNTAKSMGRSLRSFLRFAHATGRTSTQLWGAVPTSAGWQLASLPKAIPSGDVERLLSVAAGAQRCTVTGRRNYAILLLLARLGLRRGEVAALGLDDINWRAGELTIVGKGQRIERLPLPAQPGEAIAAWLCDGRPDCATRSVFTSLRPAGGPLTAGAIGHVVSTACEAAGLERIGAHRLRHTLATDMLRAGVVLPEVGQVLRHRSARSTAVYAKVDQVALRPLARSWPGTAPDGPGTDPAAAFLARPWPRSQS